MRRQSLLRFGGLQLLLSLCRGLLPAGLGAFLLPRFVFRPPDRVGHQGARRHDLGEDVRSGLLLVLRTQRRVAVNGDIGAGKKPRLRRVQGETDPLCRLRHHALGLRPTHLGADGGAHDADYLAPHIGPLHDVGPRLRRRPLAQLLDALAQLLGLLQALTNVDGLQTELDLPRLVEVSGDLSGLPRLRHLSERTGSHQTSDDFASGLGERLEAHIADQLLVGVNAEFLLQDIRRLIELLVNVGGQVELVRLHAELLKHLAQRPSARLPERPDADIGQAGQSRSHTLDDHPPGIELTLAHVAERALHLLRRLVRLPSLTEALVELVRRTLGPIGKVSFDLVQGAREPGRDLALVEQPLVHEEDQPVQMGRRLDAEEPLVLFVPLAHGLDHCGRLAPP